MLTVKKNRSFIILLLLAITFNACAMDLPESQEPSNLGWVALAAGVFLGGAFALNKFLSYIHSQPFEFTQLPPEIQHKIILEISQLASAKSLKEAATTINSLAQTNKALNATINDPKFCLMLIKNLAQQFDCSDETAAKALHTSEAKNRLAIQQKAQDILKENEYRSTIKENQLPLPNNIDLNFTYNFSTHYVKKIFPATLLMLGCYSIGHNMENITSTVNYIIEQNKAAINYQNNLGYTALYIMVDGMCHRYDIKGAIYKFQIDFIKNLIAAGANPNIQTKEGINIFDVVKNSKLEDQNSTRYKEIQEALTSPPTNE